MTVDRVDEAKARDGIIEAFARWWLAHQKRCPSCAMFAGMCADNPCQMGAQLRKAWSAARGIETLTVCAGEGR